MNGLDPEQQLLEALTNIGRKGRDISAADDPPTAVVETVSKEPTVPSGRSPQEPSAVTSKNLWNHPDTHPVVLDLLVLRAYGPEWLEWEPETLLVRVPETFRVPLLSDLNLSKLQACRVLHMVDTFWKQWEIFAACLAPFNNEFPDFEVMRAPTVAQCLVAVDIANRIRVDADWSDEVKAYIQAVYEHDGIYLALPPADMVIVPPPESLDMAALMSRWPEVRAGKPPSGDTVLDEQLRRLSTAWEYLEESRGQLHHQLQISHV